MPIRAPCRLHFATAAVTSPTIASLSAGLMRKYGASERNAAREAAGPARGEIQVFNSGTRSGKGLRSKVGVRRHWPWPTCEITINRGDRMAGMKFAQPDQAKVREIGNAFHFFEKPRRVDNFSSSDTTPASRMKGRACASSCRAFSSCSRTMSPCDRPILFATAANQSASSSGTRTISV